jgi:acyl-coenzyme A thioesterase PaaI-like protein|tara:strand:- start:5309 stop:5779 length:471 start_codon:yes stop_codon:yes gene_type:complete
MYKRFLEWVASAKGMRQLINIYGPYFGAGVKATYIDKDFRQARVSLPLRWYNKNYVGVHFGGSLYSMIDPFYMLLLMNNLGKDYIVWDQSAEIEFIKPGTGTVSATFIITDEMLKEIKDKTANGDKFLPTYPVVITDEEGEIVAKANKTLYIRQKQ